MRVVFEYSISYLSSFSSIFISTTTTTTPLLLARKMSYQFCSDCNLETDGVAVIENILTETELEELRNLMWKWLNKKTRYLTLPIEQENLSAYRSIFELFPKHGMLFQHWDFGHNPMSWKLRQHPKIIEIFSNIHKTNDLLTSFDGISLSLPCEITNRGWNRGNEWFHSDQCFKRNDFECVQGFVNLYDVNDGDATLRVLKKSHALHSEFQKNFKIESDSDWFVLNETHKKFYTDILGDDCDICVKAKAGSLVLWDSRTIHQGMEPSKSRLKENIRCVPYICMTPAKLATKKELEKRIKYFEQRRTCNHWPHKIKLFPKYPRTYGKKLPNVEIDDDLEITPLMKKLVGYDYLT